MGQSLVFKASAPSNIALIKYMGKTVAEENKPSNASLSWTLEHMRTFVELEVSANDDWSPLKGSGLESISLSQKGVTKFLNHLNRLKVHWGLKQSFLVKSANNFPSDCGLASSASSFAALTLAVYEAAKELGGVKETPESLSKLSRQGSGSSCRSFFSPWAIWELEGAHPIELPQNQLLHATLVLENGIKSVSSSEAHVRVASSLCFTDRSERAVLRLEQLLKAFKKSSWRDAFEVCWNEFWDMHTLFETARPPFFYMTGDSVLLLRWLQREWEQHGDGPIVTMDAGPNIHLLFRPDQQTLAEKLIAGLPLPIRTIQSWGAHV